MFNNEVYTFCIYPSYAMQNTLVAHTKYVTKHLLSKHYRKIQAHITLSYKLTSRNGKQDYFK